jgi:hypothetical protein
MTWTKKQLEQQNERLRGNYQRLLEVYNKQRTELEQLRKDCRQGCENGEKLKYVIAGMRRRAGDCFELEKALPELSADRAAVALSGVVWRRAAALVESIAAPNNMLPPEVKA